MKNILSAFLYVFAIIMAVVLIIALYTFNFKDGGGSLFGINSLDVKNQSYTIEGKTFTLKNGTFTEGNRSVRIFGEPVYGDLNKDGKKDAAILLVSNPSKDGAFYYSVLAVSNGNKHTTTNVMLLGYEIAPQTVEIREGRAVYNYAERRTDEPMTAQPSVAKSVWIHYNAETNEIGEFVKNFEGESNLPKNNQ